MALYTLEATRVSCCLGGRAAARYSRRLIGWLDLNDLLKSLPTAADAPFNASQRQHNATCLPDTRVDLLQDVYDWVDGKDKPCIFWLNGLAGSGKTTISQTLASKYSKEGSLGGSFFFSKDGGDVRHAGKFVTSIAVQLANNIPALKRSICDAITEYSEISSRSLRDQWHHLVLGPLSKLSGNDGHFLCILVIDALDECEDENDIRIILKLLAEFQSVKTVRLRAFLTSKPEIPIRNSFKQIPIAQHKDCVLHDISRSTVDHDIRILFQNDLRIIAEEQFLDLDWPGKPIIKHLVLRASGLFIWAATACRFIREGRQFSEERLATILESSSSDAAGTPEKHLDEIYVTILRHTISPKFGDKEAEELSRKLKYLLGIIAILLSPLSTQSLGSLLDISQGKVNQILNDLHAILDIPNDPARPVRLHHPSFRDFLLDLKRSEAFWVEEHQAHHTLATQCIQIMSESLKQDICSVDHPGTLVVEIENSRIQLNLTPEIQYACVYWIQHLEKGNVQLADDGQVHQFLQEHLLHWLEALGWLGRVSEGIHAIVSLGSMTTVRLTRAG
jgi:hypothetical protein